MKIKRILLLSAFVLALSSCSVPLQQYAEYGNVVDYSKYDMFITEATAVSFEYQPLGSIVSYVESGYANSSTSTNIWGQAKDSQYIKATPDDAVRVLVDKARNIGAYGIINVKIDSHITRDIKTNTYSIVYTASGMAIKW